MPLKITGQRHRQLPKIDVVHVSISYLLIHILQALVQLLQSVEMKLLLELLRFTQVT